jgi:AraC family transcriptional regulator
MNVLEYLAGVAVGSGARIPPAMTPIDIPAGNYAVFRYPLSGLGKGFGEIFNRLLPESGYVQGQGPLFERYDESFNPADPNSLVEIGIPVRPKQAKVS